MTAKRAQAEIGAAYRIRNAQRVKIRIEIPQGRFIFRDPDVIESEYFGPCFTGPFVLEGSTGWKFGSLPLATATLIEPVPEQLTLA